jgi:dihydrolipoamide dehydrogenase
MLFMRSSSSLLALARSTRMFSSSLPGLKDDVVIIGGGPGGYETAIKAGQLGLSVTCVEGRGTLGGTCLNVGCIPSKALLHDSHDYHEAKHNFAKRGLIIDGSIHMDIAKMMASKAEVVKGLTGGIEHLFRKYKVKYAKGWGKILSANTVQVTDNSGNTSVLEAANIVIATGSEVAPLPGIDIDEVDILSSTGALSIPSVPQKMVVIGGGVIGLELGSVWSRLGAEVTVVEFMPSIAAGADGQMATALKNALQSQGIKFMLGTKVTKATKQGPGAVELTLEPAAGGAASTMTVDKVLVCVGRRPYTTGLGLAEVGVATDNRGRVLVDHNYITNVPSIRAIGDVIAGPMLAHKAAKEGIACIENIVNPKAGHVNYDAIPSVIYTSPELAWVGLTEEQCKQKGIEYRIGSFPFQANSRARTNRNFAREELVKFISDAKTDRILGLHILNGQAGEMIAEGVLAMEYGASTEDIGRTCHAHPTLSEAVKEAAMATYDKPIHF